MCDSCRQCAIACVGDQTLKQYQRQFDACHRDFDLLFSKDTGDVDFWRKVIEAGRVYETGYPRCICWKAHDGKEMCECSRQALIYLYAQLAPDRNVAVEKVQTIREGAQSCVFRIVLGK